MTPGQIAYEAWLSSGIALDETPWERLAQSDVDGWEAVAEAVRKDLFHEMGPASDRDW